jgi:hypothetical protein
LPVDACYIRKTELERICNEYTPSVRAYFRQEFQSLNTVPMRFGGNPIGRSTNYPPAFGKCARAPTIAAHYVTHANSGEKVFQLA